MLESPNDSRIFSVFGSTPQQFVRTEGRRWEENVETYTQRCYPSSTHLKLAVDLLRAEQRVVAEDRKYFDEHPERGWRMRRITEAERLTLPWRAGASPQDRTPDALSHILVVRMPSCPGERFRIASVGALDPDGNPLLQRLVNAADDQAFAQALSLGWSLGTPR
jgi:hypothetical protein